MGGVVKADSTVSLYNFKLAVIGLGHRFAEQYTDLMNKNSGIPYTLQNYTDWVTVFNSFAEDDSQYEFCLVTKEDYYLIEQMKIKEYKSRKYAAHTGDTQ